MPNRGWTWIEEDGENEAMVPAIEAIMSAWNDQNSKVDRQYRRRNDDYTNEGYYDWLCEKAGDIVYNILREQHGENTIEWMDSHKSEVQRMECEQYNILASKDKEDSSNELKKLDALEQGMRALGARLMRPYEHWNEEERYMEYMETRHDNDDMY